MNLANFAREFGLTEMEKQAYMLNKVSTICPTHPFCIRVSSRKVGWGGGGRCEESIKKKGALPSLKWGAWSHKCVRHWNSWGGSWWVRGGRLPPCPPVDEALCMVPGAHKASWSETPDHYSGAAIPVCSLHDHCTCPCLHIICSVGLHCTRMHINFQGSLEFRHTNGHFRVTCTSRASVLVYTTGNETTIELWRRSSIVQLPTLSSVLVDLLSIYCNVLTAHRLSSSGIQSCIPDEDSLSACMPDEDSLSAVETLQ